MEPTRCIENLSVASSRCDIRKTVYHSPLLGASSPARWAVIIEQIFCDGYVGTYDPTIDDKFSLHRGNRVEFMPSLSIYGSRR